MTTPRRSALLAICLAIVMFNSIAFAQAAAAVSTPAAGPTKIAFVNIQEAVITCTEGKQESDALQKRFSTKQAALKAKDDELKKLKDDFQVNGPKLSDDERNNRQRVIADKQKIFERDYTDYQSETQEAQQDAINKILKKMLPVLDKYVTANGYTAVFDISNAQTPVIWVRPDAVITQQLVNAYNAQSTAAAPATPASPRAAGGAATPKR